MPSMAVKTANTSDHLSSQFIPPLNTGAFPDIFSDRMRIIPKTIKMRIIGKWSPPITRT